MKTEIHDKVFFAALVVLVLLAISLKGQTVGTVAVTTLRTVTATAGPLVCTFTNPNPPAFEMRCTVAGVVKLTQNATPAVGAGGVAGQYNEGAEAITWIVTQPTAGVVGWDIAANGVRQTGSF